MKKTILLFLLVSACSNSSNPSSSLFKREGVDSSGGGEITSPIPATITDVNNILVGDTNVRRFTWAFYNYATYDVSFPIRQQILNKFDVILKTIRDPNLYELHENYSGHKDFCKDKNGNVKDASIYPVNTQFKVCIDKSRIASKKVPIKELEYILAKLLVHEIFHLVLSPDDEVTPIILENYFDKLNKKTILFSWRPIFLPSYFDGVARTLKKVTDSFPDDISAISKFEKDYLCNLLTEMSTLLPKHDEQSGYFSYDENQFLKAIGVKTVYDYQMICADKANFFNDYFQNHSQPDTLSFYDSFHSTVFMSGNTSSQWNYVNIKLLHRDDAKFLKKTLIETLMYMERIAHYQETILKATNSGKQYLLDPKTGQWIEVDLYEFQYNNSIADELFNLYDPLDPTIPHEWP